MERGREKEGKREREAEGERCDRWAKMRGQHSLIPLSLQNFAPTILLAPVLIVLWINEHEHNHIIAGRGVRGDVKGGVRGSVRHGETWSVRHGV